jgi:hypothetical protein
MNSDALIRAARAMLDVPISGMEQIGGGRNSQVFKLTSSCGDYLLKRYCAAQRLDVEFSAFSFLRAQGITAVPEAIASDRDNAIGIYVFVAGEPVSSGNVTGRDIADCVDFIGQLKSVRGPDTIQDAAEAFFCLADIEANVRARLGRLEKRERDSSAEGELAAFLDQRFCPVLERAVRSARQSYAGMGMTPSQPLAVEDRILSPSDFGFHNAVRTAGGMVFVDFEYFGWDDPAKLVSDFMLHPGMDIPMAARQRFRDEVIGNLGAPDLAWRQEALLPVFGLKWCLILLNEFLRTDYARREFAGVVGGRDAVLKRQLRKAEAMLGLTEMLLP